MINKSIINRWVQNSVLAYRGLSLITAIIFIVNTLPLSIYANGIQELELPAPVAENAYIINEDFSGSSIDEDIDLKINATVEDEAMKLTRSGSNAEAVLKISDTNSWTDLKGYSFKLKKSDPNMVVSFQTQSGAMQYYWHADGALMARIGEDLTTVATVDSSEITVNGLINPILNECALWITDSGTGFTIDSHTPLIYNGTEYNVNGTNGIRIVAEQVDGVVYIDDVKVFNADRLSVPAATAFIWDKEILADMIPEKVETNLPLNATYGSVISWSANVDGIIASDGTVTRPEEDTSVTLTATITNDDEETETVTADAIVTRATIVPVPDGYGYEENFSEASSINSNITLPENGAEVVGGVLKLTKTGASYQGSQVSVGFKVADESNWSSLRCISMKLKKNDLRAVISVSNPSGHLNMYWHLNNEIKTWKGGNTAFETISATTSDWVTFKMLMNPVVQEYLVLIEEGTKVYTFKESLAEYNVIGNSADFKINLGVASPEGDVFVDDIKVYDVEETSVPAATALSWDIGVLEKNIPERVKNSFLLPLKGEYGSNITWSSSDEDVIAIDGTVTPPENDTPVILTATLENNGESDSASFEVTVIKGISHENILTPVTEDDYLFNENFSDVTTEGLEEKGIIISGNSAIVENNSLKLTRVGSDVTARFKYTEDGMSVPTGYRFNLKKSNNSSVAMIKTDSGAVQFYWHSDGNLVIYNGSKSDWYNGVLDKTEITVSYLSNPEHNKHSLWIDDYYVGSWNSINSNTANTNALEFVLTGSVDGDLFIDNVKIFNSNVPVDSWLAWTEGILKDRISIDVKSDLELPLVGAGSSEITWESSNTDVITNDGKVTRQSEDTPVTLTATIAKGGQTKVVIFDLNVKKTYTAASIISPVIPDEYMFNQDFSSIKTEELKNAGITVEGGSAVVENGALKVTRAGSKVTASFKYSDGEIQTAPIGYNFKLKKSNAKAVVIMKTDSGAVQFYWHADGNLVIYNGSKSDWYNGVLHKSEINVTFLTNPELGLHSLWIDDYKVDSWNSINNRDKETARLDFVIENQDCDLFIDDMQIFKSTVPEIPSVIWDVAKLDYATLSNQPNLRITTDLKNLPGTGEFGSEISWTSSDTSVISNDGKVTRPTDEHKTVKITATVSKGDFSTTKEFDFTVLRINLNDVPPQVNGEPISQVEEKSGKDIEIPFQPDKRNYSGSYAMSFNLTRELSDTVSVCLVDGAERILETELCDTKFKVRTPNELHGVAEWTTFTDGLTNESLNITIFIDTNMSICNIWIDGVVVCEGIYATSSGVNIDSLIFKSNNDVTVEDFKFYQPILTDVLKVTLDSAYLVFSRIAQQSENYVFESFELPETGPYGSNISWTSSVPETISASGIVVKPQSGNVNVALEAEVSSGIEKEIKTFNPKVVSFVEDERPEIKEMIFEDNAEGSQFPSEWTVDKAGAKIERRFGEIEVFYPEYDGQVTLSLDTRNKKDNTARSGVLGMEFILHKSSNSVNWNVTPYDLGYPIIVCSWPNDTVYISYKQSDDDNDTAKSLSGFENGTVKVNLLFDTVNKNVSVWLNNKLVLKEAMMRSVQAWNLSKMNFSMLSAGTARISNIKLYEANPPTGDRVDKDYEWLTFEKLLNSDPIIHGSNIVNSDLNLITKGYYGSDIIWTSSNPQIIGNDGSFNENGGTSLNSEVVLSAEIRSGDDVRTKEIKVIATKRQTSSSTIVDADYELLTEEVISIEKTNQIKMSLNLIDTGVHGSQIEWKSSNEYVITPSGRLNRPKIGQESCEVSLTAVIRHENVEREKTLTFIVLPEEEFVDPQHMTDEELFGVWDDNTGRWTTESKFDYTYSDDLAEVEKAVKNNDYTLAKEKLLDAMRKRKRTATSYYGARNTNFANQIVDGIYSWQVSPYISEFSAGNDWETIYVDIPLKNISPGTDNTYALMAWYNESSELRIVSSEHSDMQHRPKLELTVNGSVKTYEAIGDATVRAGKYSDTNYGNDEYLKVKVFGNFLSDETYKSFLKFDLGDLYATDTITNAKLVLHCAAFPSFSGDKRIMVYNERMTREEDILTWNTLTGMIYNYNGLPGQFDWKAPAYTDNEFLTQSVRMEPLNQITLEYATTKDEKYAEGALFMIGDYIIDRGGWRYNGNRGAYLSSMDGGLRAGNIAACYDMLKNSPYMTPELNAAIFKLVCDEAYQMVIDKERELNQAAIMHDDLFTVAASFPELKASQEVWSPKVNEFFENYILEAALADGTYGEHTTGYNSGVYGMYSSFKQRMLDSGIEVSPEFDSRLLNWAYYNLLTYFPNGESIQYGDGWKSFRNDVEYEDVAQWYEDTELQYIGTYGERGTEPEWTSRLFPEGKTTFMRADWSKDSPYLFTQVRGPGSHGQRDNTHVTVWAYGRTLLNDAGVFTYTVNDPYREWGSSAKGHNVVLINDEGQTDLAGDINDWSTNRKFDFLNQTANGYNGAKHNRNIMFVKPDMWIISDVVTPTEEDYFKGNEYKQLWHMMPDSKISISEDGKIRSNYPSGGNIIVASADEDIEVIYEDYGWQSNEKDDLNHAPYAYFQKSNVSKIATFDTVLFPYKDAANANVEIERLNTGTSTDISTALKIMTTVDSNKEVGYYYLSHESENIPVRSFGKYETDAKMVYVSETISGEVESVIMKDGTYIRNTETDKYLVKLSQESEITAEMIGTRMVITATNEEALKESLIGFGNVRMVEVNENRISFALDGEYVKPFAPGGDDIILDNNRGELIVPDKSGSSGGSSGGGTSGGSSGGDISGEGISKYRFDDTMGHWAEPEINYLAGKDIIKGKAEKVFAPDDQITRAEFLTLLNRVIGNEEISYQGSFEDVTVNAWYANAVQFGLEKGIITTAQYFRPNDCITREEMAKMIVQAYKLNSQMENAENYVLPYTDVNSETDWSYEYICDADQLGFIKGIGNGVFAPKSNATRAQSAVIIKRLLDKIN